MTTHQDLPVVANHSMIPEYQPADSVAEVEQLGVWGECQSSWVEVKSAAS